MSERRPRESLVLPVLIPIAILVVIGAVLFGFSRVLLGLTPTAAWITALIAAAGVMTVSGITASRKEVGTSTLFAAAGGAAGIAMLAGGVALFVAERGPEGGHEGPKLPVVKVLAEVGAATKGYSTTELTAPADERFAVDFDNEDNTADHNVVIASADPSKDPNATIFLDEEPFLGPRTMHWEVEPLQEGSYFFYCRVHPTTMTGTLSVAPGGGGAPPGGGGNHIVAEGLAFDTDQLSLPADQPSKIFLDNRDANVPHNVSVYRDEAYTDPIEQQEAVPGPGKVVFDIPPLDPGTYYFRCDIHPTTMFGTVVVAEAPGGDGGGGGGGGGQGGGGGASGPSGASGASGPTGGG